MSILADWRVGKSVLVLSGKICLGSEARKKYMINIVLCPETGHLKLFCSAATKCCSLVMCSQWRISTVQSTDVQCLGLCFLSASLPPNKKNAKQREEETEESCSVLCQSSPGSDWKLLWSQVLPAQALVQSAEIFCVLRMRKGLGSPFVNTNIIFMMSFRWHLLPKTEQLADFIV